MKEHEFIGHLCVGAFDWMAERPLDEAVPHAPEGSEAPPEDVRLSRDMTLFDATMLGVGALLGGGTFVLVGIAAGATGPSVVLAFLLMAIAILPVLLVYAELGSAFEDAGGGYLWVQEALRQPWGFLAGWLGWFSHAIACSLYALACSTYALYLVKLTGASLPSWAAGGFVIPLGAVMFTFFFLALNHVGVKSSIKAENAITIAILFIIAIFVFFGIRAIAGNPDAARANFDVPFPFGITGLATAMGIIVIAFEGFEIISQSSEEVKNPQRNIPRAIKLSLLIVTPLYLIVTFVALGALVVPGEASWQFLARLGETGLIESARTFMPYGGVLLGAGALLTNITALNATIYSSSRVSFAMGRDGHLPARMATIHPKRRTPHVSIWASGALIMAMAVLLPIATVAAAASVMFLALFVLVLAAYVKLRHDLPPERFGYRAPFFPILPLAGIVVEVLLLIALFMHETTASYAGVAWVLVGFGVWYVYSRPREKAHALRSLKEATAHAEEHVQRRDYRILVPVANPAHAETLAAIAKRIAQGLDGEIHLLYVVTLPRATLPSEGRAFVPQAMPVLNKAKAVIGSDVPVHTLVRIGHSVSDVVRETAHEKGASLILLGWRGTGRLRELLGGSTMAGLIEDPPCDIGVMRFREGQKLSKVLIPTHGGQHAPLSVKIGTAIAKHDGLPVTMYNVITPDEDDATIANRKAIGRALVAGSGVPGVDVAIDIEKGRDIESHVRRKAKGYDLVMMGATTEPLWRNYLFGDKTDIIAAGIPGNILIVKAHQGPRANALRAFTRAWRNWKRYLRNQARSKDE